MYIWRERRARREGEREREEGVGGGLFLVNCSLTFLIVNSIIIIVWITYMCSWNGKTKINNYQIIAKPNKKKERKCHWRRRITSWTQPSLKGKTKQNQKWVEISMAIKEKGTNGMVLAIFFVFWMPLEPHFLSLFRVYVSHLIFFFHFFYCFVGVVGGMTIMYKF